MRGDKGHILCKSIKIMIFPTVSGCVEIIPIEEGPSMSTAIMSTLNFPIVIAPKSLQ